jgi:hypothetical protein
MRIFFRWAAYFVLMLAFGTITSAEEPAASSAEPPLLKLTPAQMREDLIFLRDVWARQDKSFSPAQARTFNQFVTGAIARIDRLDPVAFWMEVLRAVALSRNGHTNVNADDPPFPGLPFRAWWFRDGLYIVQTEPSYSQLLGARIDRIGTESAEQALASVAPFISGNDRRIRSVSPKYLRVPALLHRLGMTDSDTEAKLRLRLATGEVREIVLPLESAPDPSQSDAENWETLIPTDPARAGRWTHVLDTVKEPPQIYRKPVDADYRWLTGDRRILYVRSNQIEGSDDNPMSLEWKLMGIILNEVVPNRPQSVIVDLRLNDGGNFGNAILFAQALPKMLPAGGKVFVLVSASTFSAAIVTAALLKEAGGTSVMLIGTGMGDNRKFWAEGSRVSLPNSKLGIKPCPGFEDWGSPCSDLNRCFWANVVWGPKRKISLRPDIEIDPTFAEYSSGRDPAMEKALALAR